RRGSPTAYLLSTYDEYWMGYKDRGVSIDAVYAKKIVGGDTFSSTILLDGRVVGTWKRTIENSRVAIEIDRFTALTTAERQAIAVAAERYGRFVDLQVVLTFAHHQDREQRP
ncbi:MAG: DNA glycosylase AlkZ-like family protein, partial [Anaerolineales bacterium]